MARHLGHVSSVVKGGPSFSFRIYDALKKLVKPYYRLWLDAEFRSDIGWWLQFMRHFNGYACILSIETPVIAVYSGASVAGFGCIFGYNWIMGSFIDSWPFETPASHLAPAKLLCRGTHINTLEMWAVMAAATKWAPFWGNI